jgi:mono/diheme cytochrome c family protein
MYLRTFFPQHLTRLRAAIALGILMFLAGHMPVVAAKPESSSVKTYNRDVRSILSRNCFACHGPDETSREAGVRLDIPGQADLDTILERITSDDPEIQMPPPSANKPFTPQHAAVLRQWIDEGAKYESHWSFVPPVKVFVPSDQHAIDFFIDQKLESLKLKRSPKADPFTLIRRVYLDLVGLPPTIEEADTFAADPSDQAYAAIVEKLLDSPRYGERWARRWLDLARYADTNGYEKDRDRSIWPYRDWVIRKLNEDMPFDAFTIQQIAGDMLPGATPDQIVATGFHRNTMLNEEGGVDPLEFRFHSMTDRVATTGATWLGLTTGCCQCHTHKYDPITHQDYYGMMAYLNNTDEPDYFIETEETRNERAEKLAEAQRLLDELPEHWPAKKSKDETKENPSVAAMRVAFEKWRGEQITKHTPWCTIVPATKSTNGPFLIEEADGILFASGDITKHDVYSLQFNASDSPIYSIRLEVLADARLSGGGPGMTYMEGPKGDFFLTEIEIEDADAKRFPISFGETTFADKASGNSNIAGKKMIDGDIQTGWSVAEREAEDHVAVFQLSEAIPAGKPFSIRMHFGRYYPSSLGKFRISVSKSPKQPSASVMNEKQFAALQSDHALNDSSIREAFLMQANVLNKYTDKIRSLRRTPVGVMTLVMQQRPHDLERTTYRHERGEYTQPAESVEPRLPEAIWTGDAKQPTDRMEFAKWLVSRDNPLTARVIVNRHWAAFFGTGIVSTLEDFGMQGELPFHPELLDYLAVHFMAEGWSIKKLHRLIVTSQTYQQSSSVGESVAHPDGRRLLQYFPRVRLEAEVIRDVALEASGLLHDKMYGPPVRPVQPASAVSANYTKSAWVASEGQDRFRRSVYTYQKRTAPFAMFTTFDASSGEACVARRDVSNTPLQALTLMNDPMFIEIADAFGKRIDKFPGDRRQKIIAGFRLQLTRTPDQDELDMLVEFDKKYSDSKALARVILGLDEAITKN